MQFWSLLKILEPLSLIMKATSKKKKKHPLLHFECTLTWLVHAGSFAAPRGYVWEVWLSMYNSPCLRSSLDGGIWLWHFWHTSSSIDFSCFWKMLTVQMSCRCPCDTPKPRCPRRKPPTCVCCWSCQGTWPIIWLPMTHWLTMLMSCITLWCMVAKVSGTDFILRKSEYELQPLSQYMILQAESRLHADTSSLPHHWLCMGDCLNKWFDGFLQGSMEAMDAPEECGMGLDDCNDIIGLWGVGGSGGCFNEEMGITFGGNGYKYVNIQVSIQFQIQRHLSV